MQHVDGQDQDIHIPFYLEQLHTVRRHYRLNGSVAPITLPFRILPLEKWRMSSLLPIEWLNGANHLAVQDSAFGEMANVLTEPLAFPVQAVAGLAPDPIGASSILSVLHFVLITAAGLQGEQPLSSMSSRAARKRGSSAEIMKSVMGAETGCASF
jgi:hypothetical protein